MLTPSEFTQHLDGWLTPSGFERRSKNPRYFRRLGTALQRIDIVLQGRPRDDLTAVAALYPWLEVSIPELDQEFSSMMSAVVRPRGASGTLRQPIDFTSLKHESGRWFVADANEIPLVAVAIGQFIQKWTVPFLDGLWSTAHFVEAERRQDARILRDRMQIWRAVAATSLELGPTAACELAERHFSAPGLRSLYAGAFQYLHLRCQN